MKKVLVLLTALALLTGLLPPAMQASWMTKLLPGKWMLIAGGGAEIWDFHGDGTCVSSTYAGASSAHTWRVEAATEADLEQLWAKPCLVLVIDEARYGLHFNWQTMETTLGILEGGILPEEERALTAPLPLCVSITNGMGGGGYVRMKDQ